MKSFVQYVII